jgi:hypothetical protein
MRSLPLVLLSLIFGAGQSAVVSSAAASESAHATVTVTARFDSRTSLVVSTRVLRFAVTDPAQPAVEVVDVQAAARTAAGAEIVLSVESLAAPHGPGGPAPGGGTISFEGRGDGLTAGSLGPSSTVAGRWTGSGKRSGQLVFALRSERSGTYTIPVRFVLSAP